MSEPIEALLFDLGGVIVDVDFTRVTRRWAEYAGCEPDTLSKRFSSDNSYKLHETGAMTDSDFFGSLRSTLAIDISDEQFLDGWNALFGGVIPGMDNCLARACAKLPTYVFSNTNPAHEKFWTTEYAHVLEPVRTIYVSSSIRLRKPEKQAFEYVSGEIGVRMSRILFFDDSLANVEGARAAGLQAVHVQSTTDVINALEPLLAAE